MKMTKMQMEYIEEQFDQAVERKVAAEVKDMPKPGPELKRAEILRLILAEPTRDVVLALVNMVKAKRLETDGYGSRRNVELNDGALIALSNEATRCENLRTQLTEAIKTAENIARQHWLKKKHDAMKRIILGNADAMAELQAFEK